MKIACPHGCGSEFSIMENTCPGCGKSAGAIDCLVQKTKSAWYACWGGKEQVLKVECRRCHNLHPLNADRCPICDLDVSAVASINEYARPLVAAAVSFRRRLQRITPGEAAAIRWGYLLASLVTLVLLLGAAEDKFIRGNGNWLTAGLTTAIFLGISTTILTWILPSNIKMLLARLHILAKLAFLLNFISTVFTMMFITDHWQARSWLLIGTFVIFIGGMWLASRFIMPAWFTAGDILSGKRGPYPMDPGQRGPNKNSSSGRFS